MGGVLILTVVKTFKGAYSRYLNESSHHVELYTLCVSFNIVLLTVFIEYMK